MGYFGTDLNECGHYRWILRDNELVNKSLSFKDLPFHPEYLTNNLKRGEVIYYQGGGFSVLGISGSCKDDRPGSKSVFWIERLVSKTDLIILIKQNPMAMKIINAMPFDVEYYSNKE